MHDQMPQHEKTDRNSENKDVIDMDAAFGLTIIDFAE
jgi:hypothetical protein